jgi:hypothetical protein
MPDFNSPDFEYGGGRPTAYLAADSSWWYATLEKQGGPAGALKLIVYRTNPAGTVISSWADSGILGQGGLCLQGDGSLYAVGYLGYGDNQTMRAVAVPGFVPGQLSAAHRGRRVLQARWDRLGRKAPQEPAQRFLARATPKR